MDKILSEKIFKNSIYLSIVWLILLTPLIKFLPDYLAYENSLVENTQILLLFIGMLMAAYNSKNFKNIQMKRAWLSVCLGFILMIGRELSWGRVFFQCGFNEYGYPVFYDMKDIPGHELINIVIGIFLIVTVLGVIFYFPWKKIIHALPKKHVFLLLIFLLITFCENHVGLTTAGEKIKMEELAEVGFYFMLDIIILYYSKYFSLLEGKFSTRH